MRHLLKLIDGYFISGYSEGDNPESSMKLVPGAYEEAKKYLENHPSLEYFDKVVVLSLCPNIFDTQSISSLFDNIKVVNECLV